MPPSIAEPLVALDALSCTTIRLHEIPSARHLQTLTAHRNSIYCLTFSADGQRLASAGYDRTAHVWDLRGQGEGARNQ